MVKVIKGGVYPRPIKDWKDRAPELETKKGNKSWNSMSSFSMMTDGSSASGMGGEFPFAPRSSGLERSFRS